jgi:hypothetical protein
MPLMLSYTDGRGVRVSHIDHPEGIRARLRTPRLEARVTDRQGRLVGGVRYHPGADGDRRRRWRRWLHVEGD